MPHIEPQKGANSKNGFVFYAFCALLWQNSRFLKGK